MKTYGILAYPTKNSLSPSLHNAAFSKMGISASYREFNVAPENLKDFIHSMRIEQISGVSVSSPHKQSVIPYLDEIDTHASQIGAVNTIINQGGTLTGFNTDFVGAIKALQTEVPLQGENFVIIGAGGAAKAIIYGILKKGGKVLAVLNRGKKRLKTLGLPTYTQQISLQELQNTQKYLPVFDQTDPILIQASSVWVNNPAQELNEFFPAVYIPYLKAVMDIVYKPLQTPLITAANHFSIPTITGEKLLFFQAIEQFKIWTQKTPPTKAMLTSLQKNLV